MHETESNILIGLECYSKYKHFLNTYKKYTYCTSIILLHKRNNPIFSIHRKVAEFTKPHLNQVNSKYVATSHNKQLQ